MRENGPRMDRDEWLLADRMIYGLILLRTNGRRILMAGLKEDESSCQVEEIKV